MPVAIDYTGKIVFITGGGRGIGLGITTSFARAGATCIVTYNSTDPTAALDKIAAQYHAPIHVYHCPGERSDRVNEVIKLASTQVGEIDIVIANAGVCLWRDCIDMTDDELSWVTSNNLFAPIYLARACVRHWLGLPVSVGTSGHSHSTGKLNLNKRIICVSSISAQVNMTPQRQVAYNASKAGLTMACRSLAGEWARYGVTVNTISPGYVSSDMINHPPPGEGAEWPAKWKAATPVDRFANPLEIGRLMVLLCSEETSSFMTGHDVVIDGGYTTY